MGARARWLLGVGGVVGVICGVIYNARGYGVVIEAPIFDGGRLAGDCLEVKYFQDSKFYYASCIGFEGGWNGWLGRNVTKDRLLGFQYILRIDRDRGEVG